jgi:hypothetical protein
MVSLIALKLQNKKKKKEKDKRIDARNVDSCCCWRSAFSSSSTSRFPYATRGEEREKNDLTVGNEGEETWSTRVVIVVNCYVIRVDMAISDMET